MEWKEQASYLHCCMPESRLKLLESQENTCVCDAYVNYIDDETVVKILVSSNALMFLAVTEAEILSIYLINISAQYK